MIYFRLEVTKEDLRFKEGKRKERDGQKWLITAAGDLGKCVPSEHAQNIVNSLFN